jgi:hypothetical protein
MHMRGGKKRVMLIATLLVPIGAMAQRPVSVGVAVGVAPTINGRGEGSYETGSLAQLSVERARVVGPIGLRVDAYLQGFRRPTFGGARSRETSIPGASATLVLPLTPSRSLLRPYLLAGGGAYRTDLGDRREWHFGLSGGAGLETRVGRTRPFVEARALRVFDGGTPRLVPIVIGLRF